MAISIRDMLVYEMVQHAQPVVTNTTFNANKENKRDIETIIAETAAAYVWPKQELISDPTAPSIDDVITEDGILSLILSNLTLREAVATSLLSPRWRNIWTRRPKLSFGVKTMFANHIKHLYSDSDSPLDEEDKIELMLGRTDHFICSVNSILQHLQLQGRSGIDEFEVRYFLHQIHAHHLDAWVSFAVESKTRLLGLYLHKPIVLDHDKVKYEFPCHLLGSSSSIEELALVSCSLRSPRSFNGLNNLKKLTLYRVDATEEDFTCLLSNCYTLEFLKLHKLEQLAALTISNPQSQFQTLIVKECNKLRGEIKINAVSLKNLGYHGYPVDFTLRQSSQLLEAYICFRTEERTSGLHFYLDKLSRNLPHLQALNCTVIGDFKMPNFSISPNAFIHLRRIFWAWRISDQKMSCWHLATLLEAAPFLEVLTLGLWPMSSVEAAPEQLDDLRETIPEHPHAHLKQLHFVCFFWEKLHVEFALYFIKNAVKLELMMLLNEILEVDEATMKKLRQELPAKVKLHIMRKR